MPKGSSGFAKGASAVASSMTSRGSGGYLDNASDIRDRIQKLYSSLYRREGIQFERDAKGNVINIKMSAKAMARIDAVANVMSQNTVEYNREANARYKDLMKQFQVSKPVFVRIEDSAKSVQEQLNAGHFKIRTKVQSEYRVNGRRVRGDVFRRNTMRERYGEVMGEAAVQAVESRSGQGGTTDATWLNAANEAIDTARAAVYTRRGDNSYSSEYFGSLLRGYENVSREAQARRRK